MRQRWNALVDRASAALCALLATPQGRKAAGCVVAIVIATHLIAWAWRLFR